MSENKNVCPNCGSNDVFSNDSIDQVYGGDDSISVPMYCEACKESFSAVYKFKSVSSYDA